MKKLKLLFGMILIFSAISYGTLNVIDDSMVQVKDNLIYVKGEKTPFNGVYLKDFLNGKIIGQLDVANGVYHGSMVFYHLNGKVFTKFKAYKGKFQDGTTKLYGEKGLSIGRITFKNGKITEEVRYKNGKAITTKKNLTLEDVIYE